MPYSSDDDTIDFVYGVINWKEVAADADADTVIAAALPAAAPAPPPAEPVFPDAPAWADGPSSGIGDADDETLAPGHNAALADHLAAARDEAELAQGSHLRSRVALYRALGLAYDFSLLAGARSGEYAELLDDAGIKAQARAPMTAVIKLIFGAQVDKARATEFAATLAYAHRLGLQPGALADHIDRQPGGLKAMVAAERIARRPAEAPPSHGRDRARRAAPDRAATGHRPALRSRRIRAAARAARARRPTRGDRARARRDELGRSRDPQDHELTPRAYATKRRHYALVGRAVARGPRGLRSISEGAHSDAQSAPGEGLSAARSGNA